MKGNHFRVLRHTPALAEVWLIALGFRPSVRAATGHQPHVSFSQPPGQEVMVVNLWPKHSGDFNLGGAQAIPSQHP